MFTDYNSIANKMIPNASQLSQASKAQRQVFSNLIQNPNHRMQAEKLAAYRATNGGIRPDSIAAEQMKSIQAQLFEVHKRYKTAKRKKALENENIFRLLEKIQIVFSAS